jgi:hypothetical protein
MKTLYLDPTYNSSKFRTEFRFPPNMLIFPDIKILNFGLQKTNAGNTNYVHLGGAPAIIKSIELYDGSTLLDQVQEFQVYNAVKNLMNTNSDNQSRERMISGTRLGFIPQGDYTYAAGDGTDQSSTITAEPKVVASVPNFGNFIYGSDATAASQATNGKILMVDRYLGVLRDSPYLPPNVFKNLRLVINYHTGDNILNCVVDRQGTYETLEPYMSVRYEEDENKAMNLMKKFQGMTYEVVEHNAVLLPAVVPATDDISAQSQDYFIKAFNNKYIEHVILANAPTQASSYVTGDDTDIYSNYCSMSQWNYGVDFRLNGVPWFPDAPLTGKNRRLARLVDSIGDINVAGLQNWVNVQGGSASMYTGNFELSLGRADYTAWRIDDLVKEWKMTITRAALGRTTATATDNQDERQALNIHMFAKTKKRVNVVDGGYVIQYV